MGHCTLKTVCKAALKVLFILNYNISLHYNIHFYVQICAISICS